MIIAQQNKCTLRLTRHTLTFSLIFFGINATAQEVKPADPHHRKLLLQVSSMGDLFLINVGGASIIVENGQPRFWYHY
jgi:hypothetical protein